MPERRKKDKMWFGLLIVLIGVVLLVREIVMPHINLEDMWPVILIAIGLFIGVKKNFRNNAWWILIFIGTVNLIPAQRIFGVDSSKLVWPAALIIGGLMIVFRSNKRHHNWKDHMQVVTSSDSTLNIDVTFGGRKEIVTSKEFRGGNISTSFGGTEVNMTQADSSVQPMVLNVKVFCGGVELVIPSHWELKNEIDPVMGSIEDKRTMHTAQAAGEQKRVLILRGTCTCGGVEIKSY